MATVLQPGSSCRDVISGALSLDLDQNCQILEILAVPGVEWIEQLQTVRFRINLHGQFGSVLKSRTY